MQILVFFVDNSAQEVTPPYIQTILKSDKATFGDNPYMDKLLRWADNREAFWDDIETISVADTTFSVSDEGLEVNLFCFLKGNMFPYLYSVTFTLKACSRNGGH